MRAISSLEVITEFNPNDESVPGEVLTVEEFNRLFLMYYRDAGYTAKRWEVPGGHVYAFFSPNNELSTNVWHVPDAADYIIV
ncbi:hypothetical protein SEA_COMRADE_255 [Streptomyces phage Comrade]|uniref:Uncharacterized protein n=3 Tax=Gilsonvirus comrade TaxID=2846395 RepID=A0A345MEF7_9CAUD|nr:hypothetical protein HWB84_gp023 [Streptomyces phage Comrade]AXH68938.1 hypothetical protein SEA_SPARKLEGODDESS_259 [Streptomyces phage SparkleGoddess]QQO39912.1 hypothetical protein SEA_BELFORT_260 [Streptomyces phage Belfort]QZE11824.1 hypothetical protein SEA_KARP_259 [Streptomyces phage Karp]UTN92481.1 hypothetical protein SEA_STIGMA_257 [Streptomyces phage Stigma]AXQ63486.1 hypothetical protein SEA_COMRADE_255 [Streptomyces phage Comrade]